MSIIKYVKKFIDAFPEEIKYTYNSLEADKLFHIREESKSMVIP